MSILIVDDHATFRRAARLLLEASGFEVVGESEDGTSGLEDARSLEPDVVLLDVQLPDIDGFEVARELAEGGSSAAVVLVSTRSESDYAARLKDSPARGFIPKSQLSAARLNELIGRSA